MNSEFLIISKEAIKQLGVNGAVVLGFFMDKWQKAGQVEFFYSMQDLSKETGFNVFQCRNIIKELSDKGFLFISGRGFYAINRNLN